MTVELKPTVDHALIVKLNDAYPDQFLKLSARNLYDGVWWVAYPTSGSPRDPIGFCGMVPFYPFDGWWYLKRAAVQPLYRGQGIQRLMMQVREDCARASCAATHLISECDFDNVASANNFIRAGFLLTTPERPWAKDPALYWVKKL